MRTLDTHLGKGPNSRLFLGSRRPWAVVFTLALLFVAAPAQALRCGNRLVLEGDYVFSVLQKCGPPQYRDERTEYRSLRLKGQGLEQEQFVPVRVEEWLYNFGPQYFMQLLRFENGRLIEIKNLDYGY
jgi:hypothetical protein